MTQIYSLADIEAVLPKIDLVKEIASGFAAYSQGLVEVPPVGELLFPERNGEMHIKYGAIGGDDVFVIKIATGFFENPKLGLPPFGGCMLVLSQTTGQVEAVLLEEGVLTNHRTAAAGAVAAQYLQPASVTRIGIVGTGVQARLQALYLKQVNPCRAVTLWGRTKGAAEAAAVDIAAFGFEVRIAETVEELCDDCRLIVTTTPSGTPLLDAGMIRPGTHITAMGSDTPDKQEISADVIRMADLVVADSLDQCQSRGEISRALKAGAITVQEVSELGDIVANRKPGRRRDTDITVADLTGVAVQDIVIAKAVMQQMRLQD